MAGELTLETLDSNLSALSGMMKEFVGTHDDKDKKEMEAKKAEDMKKEEEKMEAKKAKYSASLSFSSSVAL